jgi:hypothetical protein
MPIEVYKETGRHTWKAPDPTIVRDAIAELNRNEYALGRISNRYSLSTKPSLRGASRQVARRGGSVAARGAGSRPL